MPPQQPAGRSTRRSSSRTARERRDGGLLLRLRLRLLHTNTNHHCAPPSNC